LAKCKDTMILKNHTRKARQRQRQNWKTRNNFAFVLAEGTTFPHTPSFF
jgi:hypothetical protein